MEKRGRRSKKSQANILVTILIVLIAVAAVVVVGIFVMNMVGEKTKEGGVFPAIPNLEIKEAVFNLNVANISIYKKENLNDKINQIKIVLMDAEGQSQVYPSSAEGISVFETKTFPITMNICNVTSVELYPAALVDGEYKLGPKADYITKESNSFKVLEENPDCFGGCSPACTGGKICYTRVCVSCRYNSDCGTDESIGTAYCSSNGDAVQNYTTYTCNSPGTSLSSCSNSIATQIIDDCDYSETCSNGLCAKKPRIPLTHPGLVSYWSQENLNDLKNKNNCNLVGNEILFNGDGIFQKAAEKSGTVSTSSYLSCGSSTSLNIGDASFTLSAWVYPTNFVRTRTSFVIGKMVYDYPFCRGYGVYLYEDNSNTARISFRYPDSSGILHTVRCEESPFIRSAEWSKIVVLRNGTGDSRYHIYINGAECRKYYDEGLQSIPKDYTDSVFTFFADGLEDRNCKNRFSFIGKIDEVYFLNESISVQDINTYL